MIVVSFENEMREAFAAGQAAANSMWVSRTGRTEEDRKFLAAVPKTYEEWIATKADQPPIVRS